MKKIKIIYKITIWYTLLTVILLAILIPVMYLSVSSYLYREEVKQLHRAAEGAVSSLSIDDHIARLDDTENIDPSISTIIWNDKRQVLFQSNKAHWLASIPFHKGEIRKVDNQGETWLVYDHAVKDGNEEAATVRVGSPFEPIENALGKLQTIILVSIPLYLLLAVFGSWFLARRSLKPVRRITQTANEIGKGDLSRRIGGIESQDEIGDLAATFNEMLEKIETQFVKERMFSSAASHELRTPVAVIMAYSESLLEEMRRGEKNTLENRHSLEQMLKESKRMNTIISQLLLLARGDEHEYKPVPEKINLQEVIGTVLQQMEEQAADANITLVYQGEAEIPVTADQSLMTQMMLNLIENAIKYGRPGGRVEVSARQDRGAAEITVSDNGVGIDTEHLPHIFERFYRVDQSRDRSGSGLGLSIAEWIVKEHHGGIHVDSRAESGTTFTITLPADFT